MKAKKLFLKKDIIIKAGTIFECVDNSKREYVEGNYSSLVGLTKNTSGEFVYGFENELLDEWFDEIVEVVNE